MGDAFETFNKNKSQTTVGLIDFFKHIYRIIMNWNKIISEFKLNHSICKNIWSFPHVDTKRIPSYKKAKQKCWIYHSRIMGATHPVVPKLLLKNSIFNSRYADVNPKFSFS